MKMYPDDWRDRLTAGLVAAACIVATMLFGPKVGINGFWPYMLLIVVASFGGSALGRLVCRKLLGPRSNNPPDHPPRT